MADLFAVPKSIKELRYDLAVLKLKIALQEVQEEELTRLSEDFESNVDIEAHCSSEQCDKVKRIINREFLKERVKHFAYTGIPKVGKIAASLILICYLGLTVAMAASSTVRVSIMQFIMNIEERYTSFGFEDTGKSIDIPAEWNGFYYPTYIPRGMILSACNEETVKYTSADGEKLYFDEMNDGAMGTLDTENATIEFITVNGHNALVTEKEGWTSILWSIDNHILLIEYTGERDEAIQIANSVRMIK